MPGWIPGVHKPPSWPASLPTLRSLLDYLADCSPIALYRATLGIDFLKPRVPEWRYDITAFRTCTADEDDEVPFIAILFGRVKTAAVFQDGHSTFLLDGGPPDATAAREAFDKQLLTLAAPVGEGDDLDWDSGEVDLNLSPSFSLLLMSQNIHVVTWSDTPRETRSGGTSITVHLAHAGLMHCVQYTPTPPEFRLDPDDDEDLEVSTPRRASDYTFAVGDWVVAVVTLHQRESYVDDCRVIHGVVPSSHLLTMVQDYEILARHLRVLPSGEFDLNTGSAEAVSSPQSRVPTPSQSVKRDGSVVSEVASPQSFKSADEAEDVASPQEVKTEVASPAKLDSHDEVDEVPSPQPFDSPVAGAPDINLQTSATRIRTRSQTLKRESPGVSDEELEDVATPRKKSRHDPAPSSSSAPLIEPEMSVRRSSRATQSHGKRGARRGRHDIKCVGYERYDIAHMSASSTTIADTKEDYTARLPVEALDVVAGFAIGAQENGCYEVLFNRAAIACVSARWKAVVYANSAFWTTLHLFRFTRPDSIQTCLLNSGKRSLTIKIDAEVQRAVPYGDRLLLVKSRSALEFASEVLERLRDHFSRVVELRVHCAGDETWRTIMYRLAAFDASMLITLRPSVVAWDPTWSSDETDDLDLEIPEWNGFPRITTIDTMSVVPLWPNPTAYENLTVLKFSAIRHPIRWRHLHLLLDGTRHLRLLALREVRVQGLSERPPVLLPMLEDLDVSIERDNMGGVLSKLHMPAIRLLRVDTRAFTTVNTVYNANNTIFRSAGEIEICSDATADVVALLPHMVAATRLDFRRSSDSLISDLVDAMKSGSVALPLLTCVHLPGFVKQDEARTILEGIGVHCKLYSQGGPDVTHLDRTQLWWMQDGLFKHESVPALMYDERWDTD
ncbi:hypothetical protein B0H11DRAFT_1917802 [Mycena galericulata]|nr:hypothetical protein B0H11DRAFT_1927745 [Mycena galericulata]KAJ7475398.1 hypothetical protein B0H11DRAFT_1917802 [Mycena galericulata]